MEGAMGVSSFTSFENSQYVLFGKIAFADLNTFWFKNYDKYFLDMPDIILVFSYVMKWRNNIRILSGNIGAYFTTRMQINTKLTTDR